MSFTVNLDSIINKIDTLDSKIDQLQKDNKILLAENTALKKKLGIKIDSILIEGKETRQILTERINICKYIFGIILLLIFAALQVSHHLQNSISYDFSKNSIAFEPFLIEYEPKFTCPVCEICPKPIVCPTPVCLYSDNCWTCFLSSVSQVIWW